jgi:hypothetical protein
MVLCPFSGRAFERPRRIPWFEVGARIVVVEDPPEIHAFPGELQGPPLAHAHRVPPPAALDQHASHLIAAADALDVDVGAPERLALRVLEDLPDRPFSAM